MGKQAFALHAILFPKRSTSAAGVKSAKQSRVIDALLLVKEAEKAERSLNLLHSTEEMLPLTYGCSDTLKES